MSLVIKFVEQWRWQGWTNDEDHSSGGTIDKQGNILLVGQEASDELNTVDDETFTSYITEDNSDFACVKLSSSGEELWTWKDASKAGTDWMVAAGADSSDNVILAGFTSGEWDTPNPFYLPDVAVVKLSDEGDELWRYQRVASTSSSVGIEVFDVSYVTAVSIDDNDDPILVGSTFSSSILAEGERDYFAMKLDGQTGEEIWRSQAMSDSTRAGLGGAQVDSNGDVIGAGFSQEGDEPRRALVAKMNGVDGSIEWEYLAPATGVWVELKSVVVDTRDNIFAAGVDNDLPTVIKINGMTGEVMWSYRGEALSRAVFSDVAIDDDTDHVVAVGFTEGYWVEGFSAGGDDFAAVVLDGNSGEELARYQDGTPKRDRLEFADFNFEGELFAGGYTKGAWSSDSDSLDFVGVKFEKLLHLEEEPDLGSGAVAGITIAVVFAVLGFVICLCCAKGALSFARARAFILRTRRIGPRAGSRRQPHEFEVGPEPEL